MENRNELIWQISEQIRIGMSSWKIQRAKCGTVVNQDDVTKRIYEHLLSNVPNLRNYFKSEIQE